MINAMKHTCNSSQCMNRTQCEWIIGSRCELSDFQLLNVTTCDAQCGDEDVNYDGGCESCGDDDSDDSDDSSDDDGMQQSNSVAHKTSPPLSYPVTEARLFGASHGLKGARAEKGLKHKLLATDHPALDKKQKSLKMSSPEWYISRVHQVQCQDPAE